MSFNNWKPRIQGLSLEEEINRWFLASRFTSNSGRSVDKLKLLKATTRAEFLSLFVIEVNSIGIAISKDEVEGLLTLLESNDPIDNLNYPSPSISEFSPVEKLYIIIGYLFSLISRELKSGLRLLIRRFSVNSNREGASAKIEKLDMTNEELEAARTKLSNPGSALWRLHIDWEHQMFGPNTYEEGYHSSSKRHRERGYLNGCINAHEEMISHIGRPIDLYSFTEINRLFLSPHRPHRHKYAFEPAQITRIKHTTDEPFIKDVDPKYVRNHPFARWEVYVFGKFLKKREFMFENYPYLASYFDHKYGENFKLTKRMLNDEMYRYQVSFTEFRWINKKKYHEKSIADNLNEFYSDMETLRKERRQLLIERTTLPDKKLANLTQRMLLRVAKFQKWIDYFHAFTDGSTRQACMLANKALVEYGLSPSVSCIRHDCRFYTDEVWAATICEGMSRWEMIVFFTNLEILDPVLTLVGNQAVKEESLKEAKT